MDSLARRPMDQLGPTRPNICLTGGFPAHRVLRSRSFGSRCETHSDHLQEPQHKHYHHHHHPSPIVGRISTPVRRRGHSNKEKQIFFVPGISVMALPVSTYRGPSNLIGKLGVGVFVYPGTGRAVKTTGTRSCK